MAFNIKDEIEPQGRAKDAAARNANLEPLIAAGVNAPNVVHALDNEIDAPIDNDDSILSVTTLQTSQPDTLMTNL